MNKVDISYKGIAFSLILATFMSTNALASTTELAEIKAPVERLDVAIIGAGLAGLSCAFDLEEFLTHNDLFDQCNITVYEARGRTGGRLLTAIIKDKATGETRIAEMGGYNIKDGLKAKNIKDLAEELGLTVVSYYKKRDDQWKCTKYFDGERFIFTKKRLQKYNLDIAKLHSQLVSLSKKHTSMKGVIDALFIDDPVLQVVFSAKISDYEGAPVDKLSSRCIDTLEHQLRGALHAIEGSVDETIIPTEYIAGGNARITERLAEKLQSKIHLNMPLCKVEKNPENDRYVLHFTTGESCEADILILTIPCPVYADIEFAENVIPADRLKNIIDVEYSTNAKIIIPVHSAKKGAGSSYTNGRATLRVDDQGLVTVYYINSNGKFGAETIGSHLKKDLSFIESSYNILSHISEPVCVHDKQFVTYDGPIGHSWPNDPYVKASYSCIGAGKEDLFLDVEEYQGEKVKSLFAPLNNGTLQFTGEATTVLSNIDGTMEAAVEAGRRMARVAGKVITELSASQSDD